MPHSLTIEKGIPLPAEITARNARLDEIDQIVWGMDVGDSIRVSIFDRDLIIRSIKNKGWLWESIREKNESGSDWRVWRTA